MKFDDIDYNILIYEWINKAIYGSMIKIQI